MKKALIITISFICCLLLFNSQSFALTLSEEAEITLLTASPGDELYSVFGHSAVRVMDTENNLDVVFNYGTFDFNTPNFYVKFARGKLLYKLSTSSMDYFVPEYYLEGRAIYEQVLNLTQEQKQRMFDFLLENRKPENAYYHYDFFYDNCATRIRDLADVLLEPEWYDDYFLSPESLGLIKSKLNYEFDYQPETNSIRTFRDLLQPFLINMPWSSFGIDLALGLPADKIASPFDFMFLPDEMLVAFATAIKQDGTPLVSEHRIILKKEVPLSPAGFFTPLKVFWLFFFLSIVSFIHPKTSRIFDLVFFKTLGLTGLVIVFLWFFTDHVTTRGNMNILWALPTHLYYIWVSVYQRTRSSSSLYFKMVSIISLLLLVLWPWNPQAFNAAFFPIILTSFVKSLPYGLNIPYLSKHLSKGLNS